MTQIKAIIFDMDGVLVDARDWHYEALNRALNQFGFNITRYDHLVTFDGLPTRKKLEMLTKEHGLPAGLHGFLNDLKQIYTMEIVQARCKPVFQHEYAISKLKAEGYKLALASNSVRNTIEVMMTRSNLRPYFDAMVSNQDVKVSKPDPEIYLKACAALNVRPMEVLVVEDNEHGITAAKAAGAHVMVVAGVTEVTYDNISRNIQRVEDRT